MLFHVDNRQAPVRISTRTLLVGGQPVMASYDPVASCIWLSDQLPRHERRKRLFHELRHFWRDVRGLARDDESDAEDVADMMILFTDQLNAQGGEEALMRLTPEAKSRIPRPFGGQMYLTSAYCGNCGGAIAVGSIGNGSPEWDRDLNAFVMNRGLLCEVCDRVTMWRESCTEQGTPTGCVIPHPPPRVLDRPAAAAWIAENRDACRVRMTDA